jgi:hypothetical protein
VTAARVLQERLGLTEDELLQILDVDPLTLIADDDLQHRPELPLLLALTEGREPSLLHVWVRNGPIDKLLAHDFAGFEDDLEALDRLA